MAYHSGNRWRGLRCPVDRNSLSSSSSSGGSMEDAMSRASTELSLCHLAPSPSLALPFFPISPSTSPSISPSISPTMSPVLTARRGSPLSTLSSTTPTIRKSKSASTPRLLQESTLERARVLTLASNHIAGATGAAGEDARRPFCVDARRGFGLNDPSRAMPMQPMQQPTQTQQTPSAGSPSLAMAPLPLVKSKSLPITNVVLPDCEYDTSIAPQHAWTCRGCHSTDEADLELGAEQAYVCRKCGVVEQQRFVALDRQKFCAREDDPTAVADSWLRDAVKEAAEAVARGHETAAERRRRLLAGAGGTRVAKSVGRRYAIGGAQSRLETQTCRTMAEVIDGTAQSQKLQRVLEFLEIDFDWLGRTLAESIRRHVRMETKRVLMNSALHAHACTSQSCSLTLAKRSNCLVAACVLQVCLVRLRASSLGPAPAQDGTSLATIAPESSVRELDELLERLCQLQGQIPGSGQLAQVAAATRLLLDWERRQVQTPCNGEPQGTMAVAAAAAAAAAAVAVAPNANATPALLALPPAALLGQGQAQALDSPPSIRSSASAASLNDESDLVYSVRDIIIGAAMRTNVRADVRCAAMAAIAQKELADWIRTRNVLPIDVLGVGILSAATEKLGVEDCTSELLAQCCHEHQLSPITARTAIEAIVSIIDVQPAVALGVFGDGIF